MAEEDKIKMWTTASYIVIIVVIGLPIWWKATEVYRVSLPYDEIRALPHKLIRFKIGITVVAGEKEISALASQLENSLVASNDGSFPRVEAYFSWSFRVPIQEETEILSSTGSVTELDKLLHGASLAPKAGNWIVYLLTPQHPVTLKTVVFVGSHRNVFIQSNDVSKVISILGNMAKSLLGDRSSLERVFSIVSSQLTDKPSQAPMRVVRSAPNFDITFNLLVPEPHIFNVVWDIETAIEDFVQPLADRLSGIVQLNFSSQVLYLTRLDINCKYDSDKRHYVLHADDLPQFINPVESKLGSSASTNSTLNFVVLIPEHSQYPLQIYENKDVPTTHNAFLVPRWGGFVIFNVPKPGENDTWTSHQVDMKSVMQVFVSQLRSLLGLQQQVGDGHVQFSPMNRSSLCDWEVDSIMRAWTIENVITSSSTLNSLADLLGKISNIVIDDHVGAEIEKAVLELHLSLEAIRRGKLLDAFRHSQNAQMASESAFFDPSLLAELYFPEDQKFAIYVPLFVPISLPVVMSVVKIVKELRNSRHRS